jgi:hypothetical protein
MSATSTNGACDWQIIIPSSTISSGGGPNGPGGGGSNGSGAGGLSGGWIFVIMYVLHDILAIVCKD